MSNPKSTNEPHAPNEGAGGDIKSINEPEGSNVRPEQPSPDPAPKPAPKQDEEHSRKRK